MTRLSAPENSELASGIAANPMDPHTALAMFGLRGRVEHFAAKMSKTVQQRPATALAVAKQPDVLLCDEPTGAVDRRTASAAFRFHA